jgi:hypothetical protein
VPKTRSSVFRTQRFKVLVDHLRFTRHQR